MQTSTPAVVAEAIEIYSGWEALAMADGTTPPDDESPNRCPLIGACLQIGRNYDPGLARVVELRGWFIVL